jgi:hypothetical protein
MNNSQPQKITLEQVRHTSVGTLLELDIETLRDLENQADKAVYDAGTQLDWIRGVIAKKLNDEGAAHAADA